MDRKRRKGSQAVGAYERTLTEVAGRDAVREAEEVVNGCWMLGLMEAENQAATARKVSTHMRDTAQQMMRSAALAQDSDRFAESCHELALAQQALTRTTAKYEGLHEFAVTQRQAWVAASTARADASLADRERIEAAARAAGIPSVTDDR